MRRTAVGVGVAAIIALSISACSSSSSGNSSSAAFSGKPTGSLTILTSSLAADLQPAEYGTPPDSYPRDLLYTTVTQLDPAGTDKIVPGIATSWKQTSPTTWVFNVKPGVKFKDGEPVNAAELAWSLMWIINPKNAQANAARLSTVASAKALSTYQLQVTTKFADPLLPARMITAPALPPKPIETDPNAYFQDPFGTGYYELVSFDPNTSLVVRANPYSALGPPKLENITIKVVADDASRIAALESGQSPIVSNVPPDLVGSVKSRGLDITSIVEQGTYMLDSIQATGPLSNYDVRLAISYAIDRSALNKTIEAGLGAPVTDEVQANGLNCPNASQVTYDPAKARQLLAEAGYKNGFSLELQASDGYISGDKELAEAIGQMLGQVGIKVNVDIQEFADFVDTYFKASERPGLFAWRGLPGVGLGATDALYNLSSAAVHQTSWTASSASSQYDTLVNEAEQASSATRKAQLDCQADAILQNALPEISVLRLPVIWAHSTSLSGLTLNAAGDPSFNTLTVG